MFDISKLTWKYFHGFDIVYNCKYGLKLLKVSMNLDTVKAFQPTKLAAIIPGIYISFSIFASSLLSFHYPLPLHPNLPLRETQIRLKEYQNLLTQLTVPCYFPY